MVGLIFGSDVMLSCAVCAFATFMFLLQVLVILSISTRPSDIQWNSFNLL